MSYEFPSQLSGGVSHISVVDGYTCWCGVDQSCLARTTLHTVRLTYLACWHTAVTRRQHRWLIERYRCNMSGLLSYWHNYFQRSIHKQDYDAMITRILQRWPMTGRGNLAESSPGSTVLYLLPSQHLRHTLVLSQTQFLLHISTSDLIRRCEASSKRKIVWALSWQRSL